MDSCEELIIQLGTLLSCHVLAERLEELLVAGETAGAGSRGSLRYFSYFYLITLTLLAGECPPGIKDCAMTPGI